MSWRTAANRWRTALARGVAHASGALAVGLLLAYAVSFGVPHSGAFPDGFGGAFHTFFTDLVVHQTASPPENDRHWRSRVAPGDVLFMSEGHVPWGEWSHVGVVVRAPAGSRWVRPGELAIVDASIFDGFYLAPLRVFSDWPWVAARRASADPVVRAEIARLALADRSRIFAVSAREGEPVTNCTKIVVDALKGVGLDPGVDGWQVPDLLWRSDVWAE